MKEKKAVFVPEYGIELKYFNRIQVLEQQVKALNKEIHELRDEEALNKRIAVKVDKVINKQRDYIKTLLTKLYPLSYDKMTEKHDRKLAKEFTDYKY